MAIELSNLLTGIPLTLRDELLEAFYKIERNFREGRWEPSELNGGKFCEIVYSILNGFISGCYPSAASKPPNFLDACKSLEKASSSFPRSIRIQIPRMLVSLYEIRNNRGVGHVGGDVNPNQMDSLCVLQIAKWVISELIRVFHKVSVGEATEAVDALSQRELSLIWKINGVSRVLNNTLTPLQKTLVLLYSESAGMTEKELMTSLEHSNTSNFRRDVLNKAHKNRLIEFEAKRRLALISPLGSKFVENNILTQSFLGGFENGSSVKN